MIERRIRASIEAYIAAWNECDAAKRTVLIQQACAEDLRMRTSGKRIDGRAELDALIAGFQQRRPGARAVLSSVIDVQGHVFRFAGRVSSPSSARRCPRTSTQNEWREARHVHPGLPHRGTSVEPITRAVVGEVGARLHG